jgi:hypothetical protein
METPRFDVNGNAEDASLGIESEQQSQGHPPLPSIQLGGSLLATLEGGIIRIFREERELFSVDANSVAFEKKLLGSMVQVYLLGMGNGRSFELARIKQRLNQSLSLVFE